ncbi:MAG: TetR family transcriptional regulator C-terminal domain-containing protein [Pseudomonadota bacterium]
MARASGTQRPTRIQREKTERVLEAALEVFSTYGYRGSTVDQIATQAGMSKPNLLYYFDGKTAIHVALLERLMSTWLAPLRAISEDGDPMDEIRTYVRAKVKMSRDHPRESRLFANEILQGAPHIPSLLTGELKELVDQKAGILKGWMTAGKLAPCDPYHLIFSIWATTQHYADFDVQVRTLLGTDSDQRFEEASTFLETLFLRGLKP